MNIQITENIEFNPELKLQEQSQEFQTWLTENCLSKITDQLPIEAWDEYNRPLHYTFVVDEFIVKLTPQYIHQDITNWAISGYNININ